MTSITNSELCLLLGYSHINMIPSFIYFFLNKGFEGSVSASAGTAASDLFEYATDDHPRKSCLGDAPLLTEFDESTKTKGFFLVGPSVQHEKLSFCFVYKFRQRFALVADAICHGLGIGMLLYIY